MPEPRYVWQRLRWRWQRLWYYRWYREEAAAGRYYYPVYGKPLAPAPPIDRSGEVRSVPRA